MRVFVLLLLLFMAVESFAQQGINWGPEITVSDGSIYGNYRPRATIVDGDVPVVVYGRAGVENLFISRWNGTSFDAPIGIVPTGHSSYIPGWTGPDISSKGDTVIAVFKLEPLETGNVYSVRSVDGGLTFSDTIRVDSHETGVAWMPSMEMDENGNPTVACMIHDASWSNPRYAVIQSSDGGLTYNGENEIANAVPGEACDCCPAEVVIKDQRQLLLFRNNESNTRDIFGVLSTDGGVTFPTHANVDNTGWIIAGCPSTGSDAIFMGDKLISTFASAASGIYRVYVSSSSTTSGLVYETREVLTDPIPAQGTQNYPTISGENDTIVMAWMEMDNLNPDIFYSVSVPGANHLDALTDFKYKGNLTTSGNQTNPEIIYKNGLVHLFYQDNSTGDLIYRRGTIDVDLGLNETDLKMQVYPNPSATGTFVLQYESSGAEIKITNSIGQKVDYSLGFKDGITILNLQKAPKGIYFLSYYTISGSRITKSLIIN